MSDIRPELFDDVADQLEKMEHPLSLEWMKRRNVSLPELAALSGRLALIIRGYTALRPAEQIAFITRGVLTSRPIDKPAETILGERHSAVSENTPQNEDQGKQTNRVRNHAHRNPSPD